MSKPRKQAWSAEERTRHRWRLGVALGVAATGFLSAGAELSAVERPRPLTVALWVGVAVVGCGVSIAEGLGGLRDRRARAKAGRQRHRAEQAAIMHVQGGTDFTGRHAALRDLAEWIANASGAKNAVFVVTGGPGSGKSALLGRLLALASRRVGATAPEERDLQWAVEALGGVDVFVDARRKSVKEVAAELAERAGVDPSADELVDALASRGRSWLLSWTVSMKQCGQSSWSAISSGP
jgi:hypothetical protein